MRSLASLTALSLAAAASAALVVACSADDRARSVSAGASAAPVRASTASASELPGPRDARTTLAQLETIGALGGLPGLDVGRGRTLVAQAGALRLTAGAKARALSIALPARSAGAQRFEVGAPGRGLWLELTPEVGDVAGSVVDGAVVYRGALTDTDLVVVAGDRQAEELRVARSTAAPTTARWRVKTGPAVRSLRVREGRVELLDASGRVQLASAKMVTLDAAGARRAVDVALRGEGDARELVATWSTRGVAWPLVVDPIWTPDVGPNAPRRGHAAVLLPDGRLMIYGGQTPDSVNPVPLQSAEIYDPAKHTWTTVSDPGWPAPHADLALVDVGGGTMRVFASHDDEVDPSGYELYDFVADKWSQTGKPTAFHAGGALLPIAGGKLLAVGGSADGTALDPTSVAEVFDPTTGTWTQVDSMAMARADFAAVVLQDGKVLVLGGASNHDPVNPATRLDYPYGLSTAELFDPAAAPTKQWSAAPSLAVPRYDFTATVLNDYRVLAVGGLSIDLASSSTGGAPSFLATSELLDPAASAATMKWTAGPALSLPRAAHTATLLNGKLFVIGGGTALDYSSYPAQPASATARAEVFDPSTLTATTFGPWTLAGIGSGPRLGHTATLDAAKAGIYLVGGLPQGTSATDDFTQSANGVACASADECATGNCVDGVCCDKPCAGQCQTCAGATKGTCADVTGPDLRGTCGDPACADTCNAGKCVFKDATTVCGSANCYGSTLTPPGHCDATSGACLAGAPHVCAGNVRCADATSCKAKCASDADCAAGACDASNGVCTFAVDGGLADAGDAAAAEFDATPPKLATSVKHCTQASDCSTGFCVDGVCCDTACGEACHSCALPSSPGHCALEPIGVDLRNECGPALSCLGTCGAEGNCAVAQKGTTCAPSRCVSASTGLGPAACSAEGAKCPTDDSIAFDCAPYVCDQAVGACLTNCQTTADCANGTICDANVCVVPVAPTASSGCSYGGGTPVGAPRSFAGVLALLGISLFAARRRARAAAAVGTLGVSGAIGLAGCSARHDAAEVDAGATAATAPASAATTSLAAEVKARPRLGVAIAARTAIARDGAAFRFTTRKPHAGRLEARLSADARTLTLADAAAPGAWIELVAVDRGALAAQLEDSAVVARGGARDVLLVGGDDHVEEIQIARTSEAAVAGALRYQLRRGPGVARVRVSGDRVEVLDRAGAVRLRSDAPYAVDARGAVRAMHATLAGDALTFTLDAAGLVAPIALDPAWSAGGSLAQERFDHSATRLADGRVLVAGGATGPSAAGAPALTATCEIYDPASKTWAATTSLSVARSGHGAVLLDDGRVLVAGGASPSASSSGVEIFDPSVTPPTWTSLGGSPLPMALGSPVVFKLADGRVLIAGGADYMSMPLSQAFLFDPKAAAGSQVAELDLPAGRDGAAAALLPDGSLMIVGGVTASLATGMSVFDSEVLTLGTTPGWTSAPAFTPTRAGIGAFSTAKGLLVVGGATGGDAPAPYLYDATTTPPKWSDAPTNAVLRYASTNARLALPTKTTTDRVMVSGGVTGDGAVSAVVEIYDVAAGTWSTASSLSVPRVGHTVTQLADGSTLVAGGTSDGKTALKTADTFVAAALGTACVADGDCFSGACTDGVCCAVASCGAGKQCSADGTACVITTPTSCTAATDCKSGFCANGVCCDAKCDGVCEACNLSGSIGTCTSLGPTCLGEPADAAAPVSDAATDGPPTVREAFTRCAKGSDCGTGHCVEGVCCDTECTDRCHSCVLSGSIGKCTVEPAGVDLRHECGPGRACLGTCAAGACVGSSAGTQCDVQKCTGPSTGIGPALCDKAGGTCQTDKVAPFDCSPYACEPAFGACRGTCTQSDECAQGFFCDTPSQTCVANPTPNGGSSGCALGADAGAGAGSFALAIGLAALGLAARRRRTA